MKKIKLRETVTGKELENLIDIWEGYNTNAVLESQGYTDSPSYLIHQVLEKCIKDLTEIINLKSKKNRREKNDKN